ncbi:hypothetical protein VTK56DRAFT_1442 [Thermocarpiscus australiensis]
MAVLKRGIAQPKPKPIHRPDPRPCKPPIIHKYPLSSNLCTGFPRILRPKHHLHAIITHLLPPRKRTSRWDSTSHTAHPQVHNRIPSPPPPSPQQNPAHSIAEPFGMARHLASRREHRSRGVCAAARRTVLSAFSAGCRDLHGGDQRAAVCLSPPPPAPNSGRFVFLSPASFAVRRECSPCPAVAAASAAARFPVVVVARGVGEGGC